jgi:hypothetical protein
MQSVLEVAAQRNNVPATEVCLKYGVGGGGKALVIAAILGFTGVAKAILAHWQEDEEMVRICAAGSGSVLIAYDLI